MTQQPSRVVAAVHPYDEISTSGLLESNGLAICRCEEVSCRGDFYKASAVVGQLPQSNDAIP